MLPAEGKWEEKGWVERQRKEGSRPRERYLEKRGRCDENWYRLLYKTPPMRHGWESVTSGAQGARRERLV